MGGVIWLASALLVLGGLAILGWVLAAAIAIMVALDASIDFCALPLPIARPS